MSDGQPPGQCLRRKDLQANGWLMGVARGSERILGRRRQGTRPETGGVWVKEPGAESGGRISGQSIHRRQQTIVGDDVDGGNWKTEETEMFQDDMEEDQNWGGDEKAV